MTRAEAKSNLEALGMTEVTDEMVTNYLNQVNKDIQKEKDRAEQYKRDADKVKDLTAQLEEMQNANLSDIDKANKATEAAQNQLADLQKKMARMETLKSLADK